MSAFDALAIDESAEGVTFALKVVPGASRSKIVGLLGAALKVAVAAPPEDGKANEEVIRVLAGALSVARSDVEIISGETRPQKRVLVRSLTAAEARARLANGKQN
ncbi:MAG: DUF167 domain-containing protein [Phycisphaerae bacterium]